jgi:hypothetical protein
MSCIPTRWRMYGLCMLLTVSLPGSTTGLAATNSYVPAAGGNWNTAGNWSLGHAPINNEDVEVIVSGSANKWVTYGSAGAGQIFNTVTIDGDSSGHYAGILHDSYVLDTDYMYIGENGEAYHWMEGSAYLNVDEILYVGYQDPAPGYFYLATDTPYSGAGVNVDNLLYVGYQGNGIFDHVQGGVEADRVYIGQNNIGEYNLSGSTPGSVLDFSVHMVIGNAAAGGFNQTGGTVNDIGSGGVLIGLNSGGSGTYSMQGGEANLDHISIGFNGDGFFTQSGGTVNTVSNINIGSDGTHPLQAWYKISNTFGSASLNVGGDLRVGPNTLGKYEQTGGTVEVTGDLEIWKGTTSPVQSSYVYLGLNAGTLKVDGEVINHTGYFDQDGGIVSASDFTNDSSQGVNLDNNADLRVLHLINSQGTFHLLRNAKLRGPLLIPPSTFFLCNFTNDGTFQMGATSFDGGLFQGILTNNGTFDYYQGDFSVSSLINNGTFNCNVPFSCARFEQNAYSFTVTPTNPITASGAGQVNAIENNNNLTIQSGASVHLGTGKPLVNNQNLYTGGTIDGDLENNNYLLPSSNSAIGVMRVEGDLTQSNSGHLRIRLGGTGKTAFDRVVVIGTASLDGTLDVRLVDSFVPVVGNSFTIMTYASRSGAFDPVSLPALPHPHWYWDVEYTSSSLKLNVLLEGDCDGDGSLDYDDFLNLCDCLHGPDHGLGFGCSCNDLDNDGDVTVLDAAEFQARYPD